MKFEERETDRQTDRQRQIVRQGQIDRETQSEREREMIQFPLEFLNLLNHLNVLATFSSTVSTPLVRDSGHVPRRSIIIGLDLVIDGVILGPRLRENGGEIHLDIRKRERKREI